MFLGFGYTEYTNISIKTIRHFVRMNFNGTSVDHILIRPYPRLYISQAFSSTFPDIPRLSRFPSLIFHRNHIAMAFVFRMLKFLLYLIIVIAEYTLAFSLDIVKYLKKGLQ
jgi:hypothetical protein